MSSDISIPNCPICCEIYTKNIRKKLTCPYCNYSSCTTCYKTYIFNNLAEPNCMNCRKRMPREVIYDNYPKKFINTDYKKHRENMLIDQEMAMMPSTQNILELKNRINQMERNQMEINQKISQLEDERAAINAIIYRYNEIYNRPHLYYSNNNNKIVKKESSQFIKPCPKNECRGFLSTKYNCGVCGTKVCPHCHEIKKEKNDEEKKEEEHKCDPAIVESIKLIKAETKSCPKCGVCIYKAMGCSQMWCTSCKTAFDWKTGSIVNGVIHNPHYFEYLRSIGQEEQEIRNRFEQGLQGINCLTWDQLRYTTSRFSCMRIFDQFVNDLWNISRQINHIRDIIIPSISNNFETPEQLNADLRVMYLNGYISKDELKIKVQRRDKKNIYNQNIREVIQMYSDVLSDILRNFSEQVKTVEEKTTRLSREEKQEYIKLHNQFVEEVIKLNSYTRKSADKIMNDFNYTFCPSFIYNLQTNIIN